MGKKRTAEEKRLHLVNKLRKLEDKIKKDSENAKEATSDTQSPAHNAITDENIENIESLPPEIDEALIEHHTEEEMTEDILAILGDAPDTREKGQYLHRQIAERWSDILQNGLKKDEKECLTKENPAFQNCELMVAPKLNPEVIAAISEMAKKRDQIIEKRQQQVSTVLACLGSALQLCVKEDLLSVKLEIIKKLNEAARLLCDSLYLDTKGRRSLVLSVINRDLKDFLVQSQPCTLLFGENLTEKIKTAKSVQKSGSDLKIPDNNSSKKYTGKQNAPPARKTFATNKALNWRGPPRPDTKTYSAAAGGPPHYNRRFQPFQGQKKKDEKPYQRFRK